MYPYYTVHLMWMLILISLQCNGCHPPWAPRLICRSHKNNIIERKKNCSIKCYIFSDISNTGHFQRQRPKIPQTKQSEYSNRHFVILKGHKPKMSTTTELLIVVISNPVSWTANIYRLHSLHSYCATLQVDWYVPGFFMTLSLYYCVTSLLLLNLADIFTRPHHIRDIWSRLWSSL